jgi:hypothetical protein
MTSIKGTISMRAFLIGTGDENLPRASRWLMRHCGRRLLLP